MSQGTLLVLPFSICISKTELLSILSNLNVVYIMPNGLNVNAIPSYTVHLFFFWSLDVLTLLLCPGNIPSTCALEKRQGYWWSIEGFPFYKQRL